ncbi:MAG: hypothetical protein HY710_13470 [Candidatus Latescibacteria bacterium]|nr:hypothetical protein [Candidatus Latescibacterota bacterium]
MTPLTDVELTSLIRLLSDDDATILAMVTAKLLESGDRIVPVLQEARTRASEPVRARIDGILARLSGDVDPMFVLHEWHELADGEADIDLERGVAALARFGDPKVDWELYHQRLDRMADEVAIRLAGVSEPFDIVQTLSEYLFQEQDFQGEPMDKPDGSYMNRVLDRRRGIPITLSAVCLLIAQRLDLPIYGVGLPAHFIVKYQTAATEILFDPFSGGTILTRDACADFLTRIGYRFTETFLDPVPNRYVLARMLNNLIMLYSNLGEHRKIETLLEYRRLVTGEE